MKRLASVVVAGFLVAALPAVAGAGPIGVDWSGGLWSINTATGKATHVGQSSLTGFNSLAVNSAGQVFTVDDAGRLVRLDPATGAVVGTPLALSGLPAVNAGVRALEFSASGTLYAVLDNNTSGRLYGLDSVYTLDVATGAAAWVCNTTYWGLQSLEFIDGVAYTWEGGRAGTSPQYGLGLATVNLASGAVTDVNGTLEANSIIQSLAFGADGVLYGVDSAGLYTIDRATGARTLVGTGWDEYTDLRGFDFAPDAAPVPEPATLLTFGAGLLALAHARRRR
jgi:hypothetical protein